MMSANGGNFELASLLLLLNVKLHDPTLLIEEAQVLLIVSTYILNKSIIERNENTFEHNFPDGIFHAPLSFAVDSELTLITICC